MKEAYLNSVLDLIRDNPSIFVSKINSKLGIDNYNLVCSLIIKMEKDNLIETRIAGMRKHCYIKGVAPKILISSSAQKLFKVIKDNPNGIPLVDAVEIANLPPNGRNYINELVGKGLAHLEKVKGKKIRAFPNSHPSAAGVDSLKEVYPLSQEEIDILMTPGNTAEEIIENSGMAGGLVKICLKSALGKCGAWTINEARSLLGISVVEKEKCLVK